VKVKLFNNSSPNENTLSGRVDQLGMIATLLFTITYDKSFKIKQTLRVNGSNETIFQARASSASGVSRKRRKPKRN
jgi:hypothetical protein